MTAEEPATGSPEEAEGSDSRSPVELARAVGLGLRDTWHSMVEEGRRAARATHDRRWREFEEKTKRRRNSPR